MKMARNLKCHIEGEDLTKSIDRLKKVDVFEILKQESTFYEWMYYPICPFQPVLENKNPKAFIDELPRESGVNSLDIPVMMGIVSDEGLLGSAPILVNKESTESFKKEVREKYPLMFGFDHLKEELQERIKTEIDEFYFKDGHNYDLNNHQNLTNLFSDAFFVSGFDEYLEKRLSQKSAETYVYILDHKPTESMINLITEDNESFGVTHGDETRMLFPFPSGRYSEKDILLREAMVKMWVNFATYGNPTPSGSHSKWKPATEYPWNYARLGSRDLNNWYILDNENNFARERIEFWKKVNSMISEGEKQ
ncbi:CES5A.2 family protein [Megaselia abdita]